jgi:MFS family permease
VKASGLYVLSLLFVFNVLLALDKTVLTILVEPIRKEFGLSDLQLGALMGLVYAISLGVAAVPLAVVADRANRRNLAALCVAAWSVMTALCGLAQNLSQLVLARIGVGIGEAGGGPTAISMIADLYPGRRRATAMAVFSMGAPCSALINLMLVTQITHAYGWRASLMACSVPGMLLAIALRTTIREPPRGATERQIVAAPPPLMATLRFILGQHSLVHLLLGATLSYLIIAGMGSWHFTFLVRSHHLKLNEIGPVLGTGIAVLGVITTLLSGFLADRLGARDERYRVWLIAGGSVATFALGVGSLLVSDWRWSVTLVGGFAAMATFWFATTVALAQGLVHVRMRATVAGLMFLLSNLIGYGLGPIAVGRLSDELSIQYGENGLRYALVSTVALSLWAAAHFLSASRTLHADLARADSERPAGSVNWTAK